MRYLLAVSGGVDSMVLLEMWRKNPELVLGQSDFGQETAQGDLARDELTRDDLAQSEIMVAHFNHGARPSSDADERLVREYCVKHQIKCFVGRAALPPNVAEAPARQARYRFLFQAAEREGARLVTAHHRDDLIESIAINLLRGTGWRGLAALDDARIWRPLLKFSKAEILRYAAEHQVVFRTDPTNSEERYLRNRVRLRLTAAKIAGRSSVDQNLGAEKREIFGGLTPVKLDKIVNLWYYQKIIKRQIKIIEKKLLPLDRRYLRAWFRELDDRVASELLLAAAQRMGISLTRPQLKNFLMAARTFAPEKKFNLPGDRLVTMHKTYFEL